MNRFYLMSALAWVVLLSPSCTTSKQTDERTWKPQVATIAMSKHSGEWDFVQNKSATFILATHRVKISGHSPINPIAFFIFDIAVDSVIHEGEIDNGSVEWSSNSQILVTMILGAITGDEDPEKFRYTYDVLARQRIK